MLCQVCQARIPKYKVVCYSCGSLQSSEKLERKIQLNILNELRELNGKREISEEEVRQTDPLEAIKRAYAEGRISIEELEDELEVEIRV